MNYAIEGIGALVNENGEETPLKAGDFALVNLLKNTNTGIRAKCLSR